MSNVTHRLFSETIGGRDPDTFIGNKGEITFNPDTLTFHYHGGDGEVGGYPLASGGGGGTMLPIDYYDKADIDAMFPVDFNDLTNQPTIPTLGNFNMSGNGITTNDGSQPIQLSISGPDGASPPSLVAKTWQFNVDGSITFPDGSTMSSAAADSQTLSFNTTSNILSISGGNTVDLSTLAATGSVSSVDPSIITDGGASANDILTWDGANWIPTTRTSLLGEARLDNLADTAIGTIVGGQFLVHDGTDWINKFATIKDLLDVSTSMTPADGEVLTWNNTTSVWEAQAAAPAGSSLPTGADGQVLIHDATDWQAAGMSDLVSTDGNNVLTVGSDNKLYVLGSVVVTNSSSTDWTTLPASYKMLVNVSPSATAIYVDSGATNYTKVALVEALNDLSNVNTTPTDGQVLTWDNTAGEWIAASSAGGATTLGGLTGVDSEVDDPRQANDFLVHNGSTWVAGSVGINQLSDVSTTLANLPTDGDVLSWDNGSQQWVPATPASGLPDGANPGEELTWNGSAWIAGPNGAYRQFVSATDDTAATATIAGAGVSVNTINKGLRYYNTTDNTLRIWDGAQWNVVGGSGGANELTDLSDVILPAGSAQGDVLAINASGNYEFTTPVTGANELTDLSDVILPAGSAQGDVLTINATGNYEFLTPAAASGGSSFYNVIDANTVIHEVQYAEFDYTGGGANPFTTITTRDDGSDLIDGDVLQIIQFDGNDRTNTEAMVEAVRKQGAWSQYITNSDLNRFDIQYITSSPYGPFVLASETTNFKLTGAGVGAIYYAQDAEKYRLRTSAGWVDLGGGGSSSSGSTYPTNHVYVGDDYVQLQLLIDEIETAYPMGDRAFTVLLSSGQTHDLVFSVKHTWSFINVNIPKNVLGGGVASFNNLAMDIPRFNNVTMCDGLQLHFKGCNIAASPDTSTLPQYGSFSGVTYDYCHITQLQAAANDRFYGIHVMNSTIQSDVDLSTNQGQGLLFDNVVITGGDFTFPTQLSIELHMRDVSFMNTAFGTISNWPSRAAVWDNVKINNTTIELVNTFNLGTTKQVQINYDGEVAYCDNTITTVQFVTGSDSTPCYRSSKVFFDNGSTVPTFTNGIGGSILWEGGVAPTLTPNGSDIIEFIKIQTGTTNNPDVIGRVIALNVS